MDALNRCLVAIRLPDELRAALVDVQHQLRRRAGGWPRWTPSEELMLTMVMLGELAPHQIFRLQEEMGPYVARHRPSVDVGGGGGSSDDLAATVGLCECWGRFGGACFA